MSSIRFIGELTLWQGILLAALMGGASWWLYWRETKSLTGIARWLLPTLRTAAIALVLLVLTAPVLHHRYREGQPGRLRFLIDSSRSMSIQDRHLDRHSKLSIARSLGWVDPKSSSPIHGPSDAVDSESEAIERFDKASRYDRALDRLLVAEGGLLSQLRNDFEIVVTRFDRQRTVLWESALSESTPLPGDPHKWLPEEFVNATELGVALASATSAVVPSKDSDSTENNDPSLQGDSMQDVGQASEETLVLLSDGRNTSGISPLAVAENLSSQRRPVFVIGMGSKQNPEDISLLAVEHPERVFERDMLRGTLVVRDRMQVKSPIKMVIKHAGEIVWEETRTLAATDRGRVDFAIAVKPIITKIQQNASQSISFTSVPLHLEAVIETIETNGGSTKSAGTFGSGMTQDVGEADLTNNSRTFHVSAVTKRSRLLLVDGRSRWETRYLHNMFERDPAWQVDIVLPDHRDSPAKLLRGNEPNQWPATKDKLLEYDLVILGELPHTALPGDALEGLKSFVESSGGGLIVVDGQRGELRNSVYKTLHGMLPVEWVEDKRVKPDPVAIHLSPAAKAMSAFQLTPNDPAKNELAWSELPTLHMTTTVNALPGSEVLATYACEDVETPLMVTRQFGAGRVFYSGTDETWRWRYKVADTYHQRFWNQIGRWVMRLPMSVQGQFVSIDSGKLVYQPRESIVLRTRLRNANGEPARGLAAEAIVTEISSDGASDRVVAVVPLDADDSLPGVYSGQIEAPVSGNYRVTIVAPGLTSEALNVHSEFSVVEPDGGEMDQLSCDEPLLMKLAESTRGHYLSEEHGDKLVDLLRPLSRGRIIESDTLLWQSYWWFVPIVLLLSIEWWIRKRIGLI